MAIAIAMVMAIISSKFGFTRFAQNMYPVEGTLLEGTILEGTLLEGTLLKGTLQEGTLLESTLQEVSKIQTIIDNY